jgi:hypothetical protein
VPLLIYEEQVTYPSILQVQSGNDGISALLQGIRELR